MSYSLQIFTSSGIHKFILPKRIVTVGSDKDCDISFAELSPFSVIHNEQTFRCIPLEKESSKKISGPWNQELNSVGVFKTDTLTFIIYKTHESETTGPELKDWDFSKLPKDT